jgi:hypothetical protein
MTKRFQALCLACGQAVHPGRISLSLHFADNKIDIAKHPRKLARRLRDLAKRFLVCDHERSERRQTSATFLQPVPQVDI